MQNMRRTITMMVVCFLCGCSISTDSTKQREMAINQEDELALNGNPRAVQLIKENWSNLLAKCPGLKKYRSDLSFVTAEDMLDPIYGKMARAEVSIIVSENPKEIPTSYRAWGHRCGYGISADGKTLRIQKSVCVSICLDAEYNGQTDYVAGL